VTETALMPTDVGDARELLERAYAWEEEPLTPEKAHNLEIMTSKAVQMASGLQGLGRRTLGREASGKPEPTYPEFVPLKTWPSPWSIS
jgi:hypothetical protein